jgi:hypothetical protein
MNKAMGQVDQVTQRNASAAEEMSSTAEELSAQSEALMQLMAFFRTEQSSGPFSLRGTGHIKPAIGGPGSWQPHGQHWSADMPMHHTTERSHTTDDLAKGQGAGL